MEDILYIIWSTQLQGWLTQTATYSSDTRDAKRFTRDEAIANCAAHRDMMTGGFGWLPLYLNDLEAIKGKRK